MTTLTIHQQTIQLETHWNEVTWQRYVQFYAARQLPFMQRLSVYVHTPEEILNQLSFTNVAALANLTAFMDDDDLLPIISQPYTHPDFKIGQCSYGKLEEAKLHLQKQGGYIPAGAAVWNTYFNEDLTQQPVTHCYHKVAFISNCLQQFADRFARLRDFEYGDDEIEAGVEVFEKFGFFGTVLSIARQLHLSYNQVINLTAEEVYMTLLYDFETAEYQRNLMHIRQRKAGS